MRNQLDYQIWKIRRAFFYEHVAHYTVFVGMLGLSMLLCCCASLMKPALQPLAFLWKGQERAVCSVLMLFCRFLPLTDEVVYLFA